MKTEKMNNYSRYFRILYFISIVITSIVLLILYNISEAYIHITKTVLLIFLVVSLPLKKKSTMELESIKNNTLYETIYFIIGSIILISFVKNNNFELKIDIIIDLCIFSLSYFHIAFEIRKYLAKRNISIISNSYIKFFYILLSVVLIVFVMMLLLHKI